MASGASPACPSTPIKEQHALSHAARSPCGLFLPHAEPYSAYVKRQLGLNTSLVKDGTRGYRFLLDFSVISKSGNPKVNGASKAECDRMTLNLSFRTDESSVVNQKRIRKTPIGDIPANPRPHPKP